MRVRNSRGARIIATLVISNIKKRCRFRCLARVGEDAHGRDGQPLSHSKDSRKGESIDAFNVSFKIPIGKVCQLREVRNGEATKLHVMG